MFEHIKNLISLGHRVAVKTKCGNWKLFLYLRYDGCLQGTHVRRKIENSYESGLSMDDWNKEQFENDFTTEFKIVTPAPKLLPVGTKVVVLENCSEKQYIGKELTIISKDSYGYIFSLGNNALKLNFHEVAPIEETEPHKYQEVIDLIEGLPRDKQYVIGRDNLLERIKNLK